MKLTDLNMQDMTCMRVDFRRPLIDRWPSKWIQSVFRSASL